MQYSLQAHALFIILHLAMFTKLIPSMIKNITLTTNKKENTTYSGVLVTAEFIAFVKSV